VESKNLDLAALGGFLIKDDDYLGMRKKCEDIKLSNGLLPTDPVKWSPQSRDKRFAAQRKIKNQNQFKTEILKLIGKSKAKIVVALINTNFKSYRALKQNKNITKSDLQKIQLDYEKRALEYLAQRVQLELQDIRKKNDGDEKGLILIESYDQEKSPQLVEYYKKIWHTGSGEFNMHFSLLFDSIVYSHDFGCDGIQLADFIVGSMCYTIKNSKYHYLNNYKNKVRSRNKKIKGVGIVVYPSNSTIADNIIKNIESSL
jgi:hypothetical protein